MGKRNMDSEETGKKGFSSVALRFCTVLIFTIFSFFFLSVLVGLVAIFFMETLVSSPASVPSRCKIVSSTVDLRSSKICGIRLLNDRSKHVYYPFEKHKFRCRYDYYWASVVKVEYQDHLLGQTRTAYAEAPNEALPLDCRPNFGAAWLTKDNFKVNETYDCWYTLGIPKIKLYPDGFYGCQADEPSLTEILKQYAILFPRVLRSWYSGNNRTKYWRLETILGVISGFSTPIITIFIVRMLQHISSWLTRAGSVGMFSRIGRFTNSVHLKRACFLVVYFSLVGWMATQYLKLLNFPKVYRM